MFRLRRKIQHMDSVKPAMRAVHEVTSPGAQLLVDMMLIPLAGPVKAVPVLTAYKVMSMSVVGHWEGVNGDRQPQRPAPDPERARRRAGHAVCAS